MRNGERDNDQASFLPTNTGLKFGNYDYETRPIITPNGFREYDARWQFGTEINLLGMEVLGLGLGTFLYDLGCKPRIITAHDYRAYSLAIKQALIIGLMRAGCEVVDIGLATTPMSYFAQFALDIPAVAMVTASHNENGWTGVKMGAESVLMFGPWEMARLKSLVLEGAARPRGRGSCSHIDGMRERYLDAVTKGHRLSRPIKVVVACGNGTACIVAPEALRRIGAEVIPMDAELDHSFPKYNPNPEDSHMLRAMSDAVREEGAEICLGFDGDDDRCDVVDDLGHEIFADKIGMLLARDLSARHANARFVVGIKSTALFETDPILKRNGGNHRVSPRSGLRQCRFPVQSRVRFRPGDALAPPLRLGVHRRPSGVGTARPGASL